MAILCFCSKYCIYLPLFKALSICLKHLNFRKKVFLFLNFKMHCTEIRSWSAVQMRAEVWILCVSKVNLFCSRPKQRPCNIPYPLSYFSPLFRGSHQRTAYHNDFGTGKGGKLWVHSYWLRVLYSYHFLLPSP